MRQSHGIKLKATLDHLISEKHGLQNLLNRLSMDAEPYLEKSLDGFNAIMDDMVMVEQTLNRIETIINILEDETTNIHFCNDNLLN